MLAAGQSRRLGQPKQLVVFEQEPLLRRIVRLALEAGCSPVVVVLGACDQPCREALADLGVGDSGTVRIVVNPDWAEGMSTSLRAGLAALAAFAPPTERGERQSIPASPPTPSAQSVLILVSDQLRLTSNSLTRLLHAHEQSQAPVTAARYSGRLGVPSIFRPELLPALATLAGDQGARLLLKRWADHATTVDLPEAAAELDTPEDLAALQ